MFLLTIVTIFPEMFPGPLGNSLLGKGLGNIWDLKTVNIRDFANNKHNKIDDTPYGGGAGMVMMPDVIHEAMKKALSFYGNGRPRVVFMTPRGIVFSQKKSIELMDKNPDGIVILCGRYEGIDQRVIDLWKKDHGMEEISVGDYIVFGGEVPAMLVAEACLRHLDGIMNNKESVEGESFSLDLLEYPQYTKPAIWIKENVPSVLLSGNHEKIAKWRTEQSEQITKDSRPDLWERYVKLR